MQLRRRMFPLKGGSGKALLPSSQVSASVPMGTASAPSGDRRKDSMAGMLIISDSQGSPPTITSASQENHSP